MMYGVLILTVNCVTFYQNLGRGIISKLYHLSALQTLITKRRGCKQLTLSFAIKNVLTKEAGNFVSFFFLFFQGSTPLGILVQNQR